MTCRIGTLSQRDLAGLVNCTRQTVNQVLRGFTEESLVRSEHGQIVIVDPEGLRAAASRG